MENREVTKLWDQSDTEQHMPLRRPKSTSSTDNSTASDKTNFDSSSKMNDGDYGILLKSSLRVDAKEWYPQDHPTQVVAIAPPSLHSVQNRINKIKIAADIPQTEDSDEQIVYNCSRKLTEIVKSLTYDPGQFDQVVNTFIGVLSPYIGDICVVSNAADLIFNQALCEPSFRYNAARLCCAIDEHCPLFRPRLSILCEKELLSKTQQQGLTLFLAELYMQLDYENIYGRSLLESIKNLITLGKPDDIKCICQSLKLAGNSLELYDKKTLDTIFVELETIKPLLPTSLKNLLDSVFTLRRNQWGYEAQQPSLESYHKEQQNGYLTTAELDFIICGPDGQEITTEEREFLRDNFEDPDDYIGDETFDPDDLFDPEPEMDEEIQAAFREFVRMSKK